MSFVRFRAPRSSVNKMHEYLHDNGFFMFFKRRIVLPLRSILVVPFVTLVLLTFGTVGYLSYVNSQIAVNQVAHQLRLRTASQIQQHLVDVLRAPHMLDEANVGMIQRGQLDPTNVEQMQENFLAQVRRNPTITSIYFGSLNGGIVGSGREGPRESYYVYATENLQAGVFEKYQVDASGQRGNLLARVENFDARTRVWYQKAVLAGRPTWSDIYILVTGQDMALAASMPVYDDQQGLVGVVSIDLFLSQISEFLRHLEISPSGISFVIDQNGLLVAESTGSPLVIASSENQVLSRVAAEDSPTPLIRETARYIHQLYGDFARTPITDQDMEFYLDGKRQFVLLRSLSQDLSIPWLIVVVIPEADFMEPVVASNRASITIMLIAMIAVGATGILISYRLSQSIHRFVEGARLLAAGKWTEVQDQSLIEEITTLSMAFNQMSARLQKSLSELKAEVHDRTQAETLLRASEERYAREYVEAHHRAEEITALNRIVQAVVSNLELEGVLNTLYEQCQLVLPVNIFYVAVYEERTHLIHHPLFIEDGERVSIEPRDIRTSPGLSGTIILSKRALYINDVNDPEIVARYPMISTGNSVVISYVGVPLIVRDHVVGVISMQSTLANAYSPEQISLLETIAGQAAVAVEHSRLFAEIRENTRNLELLNQMTRSALEVQDYTKIWLTLADQMAQLFRSDRCFITRWDEDRQRVVPMAASNDQTAFFQEVVIEPSEASLTASTLGQGKPLVVIDSLDSPYISNRLGVLLGCKSMLGLPLMVDKHKMGAIIIGFEQFHEFTPEEITLGELAAAQIALALAKSELVATDYLTGVYNRRGLIELGVHEFIQSRRYHSPLSAILFDIDHFKPINDAYGHEVGDQVLQAIAKLARKSVRMADIIGRYGGEEFVILLPRTHLDAARLLAERLCQRVDSTPIATNKGEMKITVSVGVAAVRDSTLDVEELIRQADDAMYAAKQGGRNRVAVVE